MLGLDEAEVCPTLKGFSFTSWNVSEDDLLGRMQSPEKRKLDDYQTPELPAISDDHAFDMDAVAEGYDGGDSVNDTNIGMEDIDEEDAIDRQRGAETQLNPVRILAAAGKDLGIVELQDQLSTMPLEYSYFGATAQSAWAGPLHWKFKQPVRSKFPFHLILSSSFSFHRQGTEKKRDFLDNFVAM